MAPVLAAWPSRPGTPGSLDHLHSSLCSADGALLALTPTVPSLALSIPTMRQTGSTITCPSHPRLSQTSYVMTSPNSSLGGADTTSTLLVGVQRPGRVPDHLASSPNIPLL